MRELGIDGIELDVQLAQTGEPVVFHDWNLIRIGGVDLDVAQTDLDYLKSIDIGSWFDPTFRDERIPLLDEVFELLADGAFYDIELKSERRRNPRLPVVVAQVIRRHGLTHRCLVSSFNPLTIRAFRQSEPDVAVAVIYPQSPALLRMVRGSVITRCAVVKPNFHQVRTLSLLYHQKIRHRRVCAWTVDTEDDARRLFAAGVDSIISNHPERFLHLT